MKLQIQNACWLGDDGWFHWGTMFLAGGRIARLESDHASDDPAKGPAPAALRWPAAARRIDATNLFIVPGLIDAHVHLREPGQVEKEGIANGTAAALKGGVTTVLDMPNNVPPIVSLSRLDAKRALFAEKSRVNYGLFLQARAGGPRAPDYAAGVKIYMSKASALAAVRDVGMLEGMFRQQARIVLHAEDEQKFSTQWKKCSPVFHTMEKSFPQCGKTPAAPLVHHLRRPRAAVAAALKSIETAWRRVPAKERPRLVIAHCNTVEEVEWLRKMKRLGHDVWGETCPHYFLFTEQDYLEQGSALQVNPPLRTAEDRAAILDGVKNGGIDFVSTDHAPHLPKEKAAGTPPSGIAGIEWLGPILLTLVKRGEISWKRYLELSGGHAAQCFGIADRGGIREGAWADLAFAETGKKVKLAKAPPEKIVTRAACHPYAQFDFAARIRATMVNGRVAWLDGRVRRGIQGHEVYES
jgi:dihydroorotase